MDKLKQTFKDDLLVVVLDIFAANFSYLLALFIRFFALVRVFGLNEVQEVITRYFQMFLHFAPFYTVICLVVFSFFHLYGGLWRYVGSNDISRIIVANAVTMMLYIVGSLLTVGRMPISCYMMGAFFQLVITIFFRVVYRLITDESRRRKKMKSSAINAMIVGTGETSRIVRRKIEKDTKNALKLVCIFSYQDSFSGKSIDGIPVVTNVDDFAQHIAKYDVERVILADTILPMSIRRKISLVCDAANVDIQDFSGYMSSDSAGVSLQSLMQLTSGPMIVQVDGTEKTFESGEQALMRIVGRHVVKSVFARDNRLVVALEALREKYLTLFYITSRPEVALIAEKYGVDRIWIDLETIGKEERQRGMNTVKSQHQISDIAVIKPLLTKSEMLVRVNHWYEGSVQEIDDVIEAGADIIMLPYWKTIDEVDRFLAAVNGRCRTTLLLETKEAVEIVDEVLTRKIDEIHIGLNDLSLSYGMAFMFELLSDGTVEMLCNKFKKAGIPYGFGGIAKLGEGLLPAEKVIMEHYRLGSTRAILSRSFCNTSEITDLDQIDQIFRDNMESLRDYEAAMSGLSQEDFMRNKVEVANAVEEVVAKIKRARSNEI